MEEGFVAGSRVAEWIQGPLEKSLLFGVKTDDRERREIRTFRCVKCGFLESYAN
jgi:hypothetical protein